MRCFLLTRFSKALFHKKLSRVFALKRATKLFTHLFDELLKAWKTKHLTQILKSLAKFLKNVVIIRKNEIFPCLTCYGQKLEFFVRKSRQR